MSAPWAVAVVVLAVLVLALTAVVARLLTVVTSANRALVALQEQVRWLAVGTGTVSTPAPASLGAPATALVTLDPSCPSCRQLALDLRASGTPEVGGVVVRLLAEDSVAGHDLAEGLGAEPVAPDPGTDAGVGAGLPHVLVTAPDGRVLAKGDPGSAAELRRLMGNVA